MSSGNPGYDVLITARGAFDTTDAFRYADLVSLRESLLDDPTEANPHVLKVGSRPGLRTEFYLLSTEEIWVVYRFLNRLVTEVLAILFRPDFRQLGANP